MFYRTLASGMAISWAHSTKSRASGSVFGFLARIEDESVLTYVAVQNAQSSKVQPFGSEPCLKDLLGLSTVYEALQPPHPVWWSPYWAA
jgi:hypothetical protein